MKPDIKVVETKKDLKAFVKVPFTLFKDDPMWVPWLIRDEMDTFNEKKNPAYDHAETKLFIAYHDGRPVGRIAAILSHAANDKYKTKNLRFGWFDTIDDYDVTKALFDAVEEWGRERGMETLTGPHGFTDLDPEGMLIDGFDTLVTIVGYYNLKHNHAFAEKYGFTKDVDYFEFLTPVPHETGIPEKLLRIAERVKQRSNVTVINFKSRKEVISRAEDVFVLVDEAFEEIYGTVPITRKQVDYYVKQYFSLIDKDLIKLAVNENNEAVGFILTFPNFSKAFQKAKGRLFPFGWYHLLKALKKTDIVDFYLAGVKKKYRGAGVDLLMVIETVKTGLARGFKYAESNLELEENTKVQALWKPFNPKRHRVRRIFKKQIAPK
jgi:hypothetical protein